MAETVSGYDQFCPVAVSLDVLGDRWAVLLLRDLLWAGPQHRHDLRERNPSIADDELDGVLDRLERNGLVLRVDEPKRRYALTEQGQGISGVIRALFEFGMPLLADVTVTDWMLSYAIADCARRRRLDLVEIRQRSIVRLRVDEADLLIEVAPGVLKRVEHGDPAATLSLDGSALASILAAEQTVDSLIDAHRVTIEGDGTRARDLLDMLPADH